MAAKKEKEIVQPLADTNESVTKNETPAAQDCISLVIPYCKEFAQGKELLYALRSWDKNARFGGKVVIIGDREDWFSEEIVYIEHNRISDNPQIDILDKLYKVVASPFVSEKFVWSNDDIYLVNPVSLAHIELPKVLGELDDKKYAGIYAENMKNTIDWLRERNLPDLNYGTHTPIVFDKSKLLELLEQLPNRKGYLLSSLYFNFQPNVAHPTRLDWKTDPFSLPVVSSSPNEAYVTELLRNKVFMSNAASGYSPWLEGFLDRLFPDKSEMEG